MTELWTFENEIYDSGVDILCGVDEAGRGPLAGYAERRKRRSQFNVFGKRGRAEFVWIVPGGENEAWN